MPLTILPIRPRVLRRRLTLAGLGAIVAGAVLGAGTARADVVSDYTVIHHEDVCAALDADPTNAGVTDVLAGIVGDGLNTVAAATVLLDATYVWCPRHMPVLEQFADTAAPAPVVAT